MSDEKSKPVVVELASHHIELFIFLLLWIVLAIVLLLERLDRSLTVKVDQGTGCHYLMSSTGHLTPRLLPDGAHKCEPTTSSEEKP